MPASTFGCDGAADMLVLISSAPQARLLTQSVEPLCCEVSGRRVLHTAVTQPAWNKSRKES